MSVLNLSALPPHVMGSVAGEGEIGVLSRNRRKFRQPLNVACPRAPAGRATGGTSSPSTLHQHRKVDSLSPSRTQKGSTPNPLLANRANTVCHSWRLRRRHLSLLAVTLLTAAASLMILGGIVPRGRGEKNAAQ